MTEPNGSETAYTYDALGRRTSTTDGSLTTTYRYDKVGNLVRQSNELVDLANVMRADAYRMVRERVEG